MHTALIDFAPYLFRTHFIGKYPFKNGIILRDCVVRRAKQEIRRLYGADSTEAYSMHMIESFNKTVDYIESVLNDEIDEKKIGALSGYSYSMFRRIFSILTGTTLSEYMRFRKLTHAAEALRETDKKIIDIVLDAGYDSPDSFGLAFKNFHGRTPT